jgi:hypothetical protein
VSEAKLENKYLLSFQSSKLVLTPSILLSRLKVTWLIINVSIEYEDSMFNGG